MFKKRIATSCFLLACSLFTNGCTETIKAVDQGTANIIRTITALPDQQPGAQTVKVKSNLTSVDVRQDPSTNNPPITTLPGGIEVLEISENADWVQVRLDMDDGTQMDGWVNKDEVVAGAIESSLAEQQVAPNNQPAVQTVKVKSKYKAVNVRRDPSTHNPPIATLPGGMEVLKISENAKWVQIRLDMDDGTKVDGWISKNLVN